MMNVPLGVLSRPFDFLVGFIVFFAGAYGFIDPSWPPESVGNLGYLLMTEDFYLVVGGGWVMLTLLYKQWFFYRFQSKTVLAVSMVGEMWAWLFISAAAATIAMTAWWLPPTAIRIDFYDPTIIYLWASMWGITALGSYLRWRDLKHFYRSHHG